MALIILISGPCVNSLQGCVLNVLWHLPRSLFSDAQVETIIWACAALGVDELPSLETLKTIDKKLQALCGINTIRHDGQMGNLFYVNSLSNIIAQARSLLLMRKR